MPPIKSKDGLKSFLLTSRLLKPAEWALVDAEASSCETVREMLDVLERRQLLTPLQTGRIIKGETEGLVLGRYKLLYRNASGSFARVFRAATTDDNQIVALKLLRERWAEDPKAVAGFIREAKICQKFIHPNIVPIFDIGDHEKFHFFTMEFVEGGNLRDFVKIRQVLNPLEATRCIYQICSALEYALTLCATHRDLKLTNVLMSSTGVAKLVDFGLAGAENPTQAGTSDDVQRALEYASLERGTNAPRNDPRSDIFFAGAIYYELLTGEPPWPRTADREERLQLQRYASVRPIQQVKSSLPPSICRICMRMMDVNPSDRYQSAAEANRDLRMALAELGEPVEPVPGVQSGDALDNFSRPEFKLLVVDSSKKRQKVLNQYFDKYSFSLQFTQQAAKALEVLKGKSPPGGILFFADEDSSETLEIYPQMQAYGRSLKVPCVAVFAANEEEDIKRKLNSTKYGKTMFQPTTLRDIRKHFEAITGILTAEDAPAPASRKGESGGIKGDSGKTSAESRAAAAAQDASDEELLDSPDAPVELTPTVAELRRGIKTGHLPDEEPAQISERSREPAP